MIKICDTCNIIFIDAPDQRLLVAMGEKDVPTDATGTSVKSYIDTDTCPRCQSKLRELSKKTSYWRY